MEHKYVLFLDALRAAMNGLPAEWNEVTASEYEAIMMLADTQFVLPMIFEATYNCIPVQRLPEELRKKWRNRSVMYITWQTQKTAAFLHLYQELALEGLSPIVVKGIVCRSLYSEPDSRCSSDEDLLIAPEMYAQYHAAFLKCGMAIHNFEQNAEYDPEAEYEVPYQSAENMLLLIELHKYLFPPQQSVYGGLNRYFTDVESRSIMMTINGVEIRTMHPTDHLFYLVLHAYKHFLHSGFGLRQLCDICLYSMHWGTVVDWACLYERFDQLSLRRFVAALFAIGQQYLGFDPSKAKLPEKWNDEKINSDALLMDLLDAGIYGGSSMSRKHSSNITLNAANGQKGKGRNVLKTVFPSAEQLTGRYSYLKEKPYLLPVAWIDRMLKYWKETRDGAGGNHPAESIRIGSQRVKLLKQYGMIQENDKENGYTPL